MADKTQHIRHEVKIITAERNINMSKTNTYIPSVGSIMELDHKVAVILRDILGHDGSKSLQEKTGNIHIHDTRIGHDVMKRNFTSNARAETAIKQAIIAQLLDCLPEDKFFNPTQYDPDTAIRYLANILTKDKAPDEHPETDLQDINETTEI